ncbi:PKD domain-containing protein [candidate division KSB1 bacterium]|nr:PKD domain-containing protein [candidate division KSB1 bacterium]
MKKIQLLYLFLFSASSLFAQWTQINNGLSSHTPTSMYAMSGFDAVWLGNAGGGVFKTIDNGDNWANINGDLTNLNVNDIRAWGTGTSMFVATKGGPFFTMDETSYTNTTSPGLTNTDINYYWFGGDDPADYAIGTNGGGIFVAPDRYGPWTAASNGLSGNGLIVNDMGGYTEDELDYAVAATDGGMYFSTDNMSTWTAENNGLSGDMLLVKKLAGLGKAVIIATHGGLFFTYEGGENWLTLVANEKFNTVLHIQISASLHRFYAFGEKGFYSDDLMNYTPIDMTGVSGGEVTCVAVNSTYIFVGTQDGVFRKKVSDLTPAGLSAAFSASPTSGRVPLTVQFLDNSVVPNSKISSLIKEILKNSTISSKTATTWEWDFDNDGTVDSYNQHPSYTFQTPGNYTVSLTVGDGTNTDTETKADFIKASQLTADFTAAPTSGAPPLLVQFSDNSTATNTTITSWEWDFDSDGTVDATTQNPSYTYQNDGNYTVSLTVSDGTDTDTETKTTYISVGQVTQVTAAFTATPTSGTAPLLVQFTDNSTASNTAITSWEWDFDNDGTVDATTQNPSYTYQNDGNYTVVLTVSDGTLSDSETKTNYISVSQVTTQLTAEFTATPTSGYAPLSVQFTDNSTVSNTVITSWSWDFDNDGTVDATTQNPSYTYQNDGNYTVVLTVSDGTLSDSETKTNYISVSQVTTQLTAEFTATPTSGYAPLSVQFTDNSTVSNTVITSWSWDFDNDGTVDATTQNPSYTYQNDGNYTVVLTVSDGTISDSETKTNYISVSQTPAQLTADFTAAPTSGYAPLSVQFTDISTPSSFSITSWVWDFDNDGTESKTVFILYYLQKFTAKTPRINKINIVFIKNRVL